MDADYIINSVKQTSETLYREPQIDLAERLLYRIQMLEGHIRVLVNHIDNAQHHKPPLRPIAGHIRVLVNHIDNAREEIKTLQTELIAKDSK